MNTTITENEKQILVTFEGELDTAAAAEVENQLQPLFNSDGRDIVIDCTDLQYIASSGLRILLSILKTTKAAGNTVTLLHVNDDIRSVFHLTGFDALFNIE